MNREFAEEWLNKLKKYWFDKDIEKAVSLFAKTTFYQETPFMRPYTIIEEINEEWQHIKNENIQTIEIKVLAIENEVIIVEWYLKQNDQEFDAQLYLDSLRDKELKPLVERYDVNETNLEVEIILMDQDRPIDDLIERLLRNCLCK